MRKGFAFSLLAHVAVMAIGYFGLPSLRRTPVVEVPVMVEVFTIGEQTMPAPPKPEPEKPKAAPKPPPKPPEVAAAPPPPPPPPPEPEPEPEVVAVPPPQPKPEPKPKPKPKPEPEPKAEPKPQPKPEPKPEPKPQPKLAKIEPKRKPKPPDTFASILKTVEKLKQQPVKPKEKPKKKKTTEAFSAEIALALAAPDRQQSSARKPTLSEIDALKNDIRRQIHSCWSVPAGAKEAESLVIEIWVNRNPDGTVREAKIRDDVRMATDPFFRAAAESALRAVLKPKCNPLKLPSDRYDLWKTMTLNFNPKEMLGS